MSTPNFEFMKYDMPLIIADMDYYDLKEQYEEEFQDSPHPYGYDTYYYTEGMTLNDLYELCKHEVESGNGDMLIKVSDDTKSTNYHLLTHGFSDGGSDLQTRDLPGINENDLLLG